MDMVSQSGIRDAFVEIIVTRDFKGVREPRPEEIRINLYMFVLPYIWAMEPEMQLNGGQRHHGPNWLPHATMSL